MSEFKYACPVCGQHIKCDSSQSGSVMECPTCFQKITVPQAPATDDPKFIITGTKVGERPVPSAPTGAGTALPPKKSSPAPAIAFVIVILLCAAGAAAFMFRGRFSHSTPQPTNTVGAATDGTNPAPVSNPPPPQPVVAAPPANDTNWTLTLGEAVVPETPAAGRIHGRNYLTGRAYLEAGTLTMRTANQGPPDLGLSVYLHANRSQDLAGQTISVTSDSTNAPRVRLRWKNDEQKSQLVDIPAGYALKIEFGQLVGNRLPGKIYLSTPDDEKSYVAGTFNADIRKPKPPK